MLNEEVIFLCYLGKQFSFCGCGWSKQTFCWSQEDEVWIDVIVDLFVKLFGEAYLDYTHSKDNGTQVTEVSDPRKTFTYDHDKWEESFEPVCQVSLPYSKFHITADLWFLCTCFSGVSTKGRTYLSRIALKTQLDALICSQKTMLSFRWPLTPELGCWGVT